jgi:hypothetical protein
MSKSTDVRAVEARLYFLPVAMRLPLKFGPELTTEVTLARVRLRVEDRSGRSAEGWGETPLSAAWAWPSSLTLAERLQAMQEFCALLARAWEGFAGRGHPLGAGGNATGPPARD